MLYVHQVLFFGTLVFIGLSLCNYFVSDINIFNKESSESRCLSFVNLFSCENKSPSNGQKRSFGKPLANFCVYLKVVGDISIVVKFYFLIVGQVGTDAHRVNPSPVSKYNHINIFGKYGCLKKVVAINLYKKDNKAHCHQK